jgi:hypothetical protein
VERGDHQWQPQRGTHARCSRVLAAVSAVALVCCLWPVATLATSGDQAATHAYLEARLAEEHHEAATNSAALKAIDELAARVGAGCAGILRGAPRNTKGTPVNQSRSEIDRELLVGPLLAAEHVLHPALVRFARTVHRLRWSSAKLTRLLRSLAREEAEKSAVAIPDLCADMRAWVTSGYTAAGPGTKQLLHRLDVVSSITLIEVEPGEPFTLDTDKTIAYRLKPYEAHRDRALARKLLERRETRITDPRVRPLLEALGKVIAALEGSAQAR